MQPWESIYLDVYRYIDTERNIPSEYPPKSLYSLYV